ncbi:TPA: carbohydrate kinase family protein [Candidatus Saccharibacteria bacterium]|nr:carbohydrate kinase family protein [Candidatus Saccharibacteria bacterium]HIO87455.1 carbohydrate kinase family protein [Candidatus Saccharibacteria bacterium]
MKQFDVVSVGAAVQDVFLSGKVLAPQKEGNNWVAEFPLGSKLDVDGITFSTGGGATNAAVTFARNGLSSCFMGKIASDPAGAAVKTGLVSEGVDISHLTYSRKYSTGYSVLLLAPNGERTILTYRGASTHYRKENFRPSDLNAKWLYISSLAGNMEVLEYLVNTAHKKGIKIAINPGKGELKHVGILKKLLPKLDLISLNKEEWQMLVKSDKPRVILRSIAGYVKYVILTDGPNGSYATDGKKFVKAGMYEDVKAVDRTGAGDAFCSGMTAALIKGHSIEEAITRGSANSTSVIQHIGAKKGILTDSANIHDMPLDVSAL